jgi:hypothetical protein
MNVGHKDVMSTASQVGRVCVLPDVDVWNSVSSAPKGIDDGAVVSVSKVEYCNDVRGRSEQRG